MSSDLTGRQLGPWLVIGVAAESGRNRQFECQCVDCGAVVRKWGSSLVQRHPSTGHAAGCSYARRWAHPVGQRHGLLVILRELERQPGTRDRERRFECICDCGKVVIKSQPYFYKSFPGPFSCGHARERVLVRERYRVTKSGRTCLECETWKLWAEYRKIAAGPFGYEARCKGCARWYYIEYYYGITRREWEWLQECQGTGCALCGRSETNPRTTWLSVDHDHSCCGKNRACKKCIRGLLCDRCNSTMLPHVEGSPMLRARFQDYLDRKPFRDQAAG
jgi:hypothetical protein